MLKEEYTVKSLLQPRNKGNWAKVHLQKTDRRDCNVRQTHFLLNPFFPVISCSLWLKNVLILLSFLSYCNLLSLNEFGKHRVSIRSIIAEGIKCQRTKKSCISCPHDCVQCSAEWQQKLPLWGQGIAFQITPSPLKQTNNKTNKKFPSPTTKPQEDS